MNNTLEATKGSCITFDALWQDEAGPIDLSGNVLSIAEASPKLLQQADIETAEDPTSGNTRVTINSVISAGLYYGRSNWLRIARTLPDGCVETSPIIWIAIV